MYMAIHAYMGARRGVGARVDGRPPGKNSSCGGPFFGLALSPPPPDKKFCGRQCMHTYIHSVYICVCTGMYNVCIVYCNFAIYVRLLVNTTISI